MKTFTLRLHDAARSEEIRGVTSFVGEDLSGSFGILPGHGRLMTCLTIGLARFCLAERHWRYLALPGAVLYFHADTLHLTTRRYLLDDDYERISTLLQEQLLVEEAQLRVIKESLHRMEEEVLRRLWKIGLKHAG